MDIEALRMEVARRHGVLLDAKDPIFVSVTLSELVLSELLAKIENASADFEKRAAALMAQELVAVKGTAETMIAGTAKVLANTVKEASEKHHAALIAAVQKQAEGIASAALQADRGRSTAVLAAAVSIAGALLAIGAVVLVVLMR
jgi:hypothetical protein